MDLQGRVVLVTGAGRGLGRSIVLEAAKAGATVVGGSRTTADLDSLEADVSARRGKFAWTRLDVTDLGSVDAFVAGAAERFCRIDGLVNNTGAGISADSLDITEEQFTSTFDFNARSTFFCSQRAARHMVAQGGGAIVNISSNFAVAGVGVRSVYCAAKAAVDSLTRSFAVEWAPLGVRVNAIAPGTMNTPGYERARRDAPRMVESVIAATPSGRIAEPREVAALAVFLLSDACAAMTGQVITVDGGQSVPLAALGTRPQEPVGAAG
jgi:NAD(P)-dependent dehydrogenase (short-subunit alcohol dehydrogenase family)